MDRSDERLGVKASEDTSDLGQALWPQESQVACWKSSCWGEGEVLRMGGLHWDARVWTTLTPQFPLG